MPGLRPVDQGLVVARCKEESTALAVLELLEQPPGKLPESRDKWRTKCTS
jgi:hypothetical protein